MLMSPLDFLAEFKIYLSYLSCVHRSCMKLIGKVFFKETSGILFFKLASSLTSARESGLMSVLTRQSFTFTVKGYT